MDKNLRTIIAAAAIGSTVALTGCAKFWDRVDADGQLIGSKKAPYVVIKQSGGRITDVYKLPDAMIQSEQGSDGWLFKDEYGDPIHIGGDMKSIRFTSTKDPRWPCYFSYHQEFETKTYEALHGEEIQTCLKGMR